MTYICECFRRFSLNAATLFPSETIYLNMVIEEMWRLIEKFPNGYEGSQPRADILRHQQLNSTSFNVNTDKEADGGEQPVSQDFHSLVSGEVYTSQVAN
ncbi:hypothetical protein PG988_000530 [Apiospora saccharicola]